MPARTKILIALATILALSAAGIGVYLHQEQEAARMYAHYEELRNRRDYRAETVACSIRFPSGNVSRCDRLRRELSLARASGRAGR